MEIANFSTVLGYRVDTLEHQSMHIFGLIVFGMIAIFWLAHGLRVALGALTLPWLKDYCPAPNAKCPRVSLLFAARDEEEKLAPALEALRQLDYPELEIIAANDRSSDATAKILSEAARHDSRLKIVSVKLLPEGWLGKPHALQQAYAVSRGDWLLFTDADVRFHPDVIRRAISLVDAKQLDHLTLMTDVEMHGFWEKTVLTFFGFGFHLAANPRGVSDSRSRAYIGIGAFQLVKRTAYQACGTHERLRMEVLDDMKLAKIVKQAGFRSGVAIAQKFVAVRWHAGVRNIVNGVTKNFFAATEFKLSRVALHLTGILCVNIAPFVALPFAHGWVLGLTLVSVAIALGFHAGTAWVMRASPLYALTQPLGAAVFCYMLLRSTVMTLRQGGVVWRDTFYPLEELRRGIV
ncbi:MAG TPA: glycosyltransferase [Candidatus Acidoferrum sp.]|jgi:glycosyltransferase involved in cell wall biosynthesis